MAISQELRKLSRRKLRYILFRIQNGNPVDGSDDIKTFFEFQDRFDGWHNFTNTWDVGKEGEWPEGHWVAVGTKKSAKDSWDEKMLELVRDFPSPVLMGEPLSEVPVDGPPAEK